MDPKVKKKENLKVAATSANFKISSKLQLKINPSSNNKNQNIKISPSSSTSYNIAPKHHSLVAFNNNKKYSHKFKKFDCCLVAFIFIILCSLKLKSISKLSPNFENNYYNEVSGRFSNFDKKRWEGLQTGLQKSHCLGVRSMNEKIQRTHVSPVFSDDMVLQRGPKQRAKIFGLVGNRCNKDVFTIFIYDDFNPINNYNISCKIENKTEKIWYGYLRPHKAGGSYTIKIISKLGFYASLKRVTFGDVYVLAGQSNMNLKMEYSLERNYFQKIMASGLYDDKLRFLSIGSMYEKSLVTKHRTEILSQKPYGDSWVTPSGILERGIEDGFGVTAFAFGLRLVEQLSEQMGNVDNVEYKNKMENEDIHDFFSSFSESKKKKKKRKSFVPIGIVISAFGGTHIESWIPRGAAEACSDHLSTRFYSTSNASPGQTFNGMIFPLVRLSITGFVFYQGENNIYNPGTTNVYHTSTADEYINRNKTLISIERRHTMKKDARLKKEKKEFKIDKTMQEDRIKWDAHQSSGYACLILSLIDSWRHHFSQHSDTFKDVPFVLITLSVRATSKSRTAPFKSSLVRLRNSQIFASKRRPKVKLVHAYDLGDPWGANSGRKCQKTECCPKPEQFDHNQEFKPGPMCLKNLTQLCREDLLDFLWCTTYAPFKQNSIHPRNKLRLADRAASIYASIYNLKNDTKDKNKMISSPSLKHCKGFYKNNSFIDKIRLKFNAYGLKLKNFKPRGGVASNAFQYCNENEDLCSCTFWETETVEKDICEIILQNKRLRNYQPKSYKNCEQKRLKNLLVNKVKQRDSFFKKERDISKLIPTKKEEKKKKRNAGDDYGDDEYDGLDGMSDEIIEDGTYTQWRCIDNRYGKKARRKPANDNVHSEALIVKEDPSRFLWKTVPADKISILETDAVEIDASNFSNKTLYSLRYAWENNPCCDQNLPELKQGFWPCPPQNCLLLTKPYSLSPDPFFIRFNEKKECYMPHFLH